MKKILLAAASTLALSLACFSEIRFHDDYSGYTIDIGNTTISNRYDGTQQTWTSIGNMTLYSDNTGTTGQSFHTSAGRLDTYSNAREGWSGSGFTPYSNPAASSYTRTYLRSRLTSPSFFSCKELEGSFLKQKPKKRSWFKRVFED